MHSLTHMMNNYDVAEGFGTMWPMLLSALSVQVHQLGVWIYSFLCLSPILIHMIYVYIYVYIYFCIHHTCGQIPTRKQTRPPDHWPLCHCAEMSIKPLFIFINDNLEVNSCSRTGSHAGPLAGIPCVPSAFPPVCPAPRAAFPNSFAMGNQPMRHQFKHVCPKEEKKKEEKRNTYKNQPRCFHAFLTLSIDFESIFWKHFKEMTENKNVRIMEYAVNVSNRKSGPPLCQLYFGV